MAGDMADVFLMLLALRDVSVGAQHAAAFDRNAVHLDDTTVRTFSVIALRLIENDASAHQFLQMFGSVDKLIGRPLKFDDLLIGRLRSHQVGWQIE